jgi:hypothetical protein
MDSRASTYIISTSPIEHLNWRGLCPASMTLKSWLRHEPLKFTSRTTNEVVYSAGFSFTNKELIRNIIIQLRASKNCVLFLSKNTRRKDIIPFEIIYAIDDCQLPLIIVYPDYQTITAPTELAKYWPKELRNRIEASTTKVLHIPLSEEPARDAILRFHINARKTLPGGYCHYKADAFREWGIDAKPNHNRQK